VSVGSGDRILVRGLRLWAHVGVLEQERLLGQWFELDFSLAWDLAGAGASDQLELSLDYSLAITALQRLAGELRCLTLEHFAERILDCLEQLYGPVPATLELRKCRAPVPGFDGVVVVQRSRHGPGERGLASS
jgi:dihydroneopterin aldolase